MLVTTVNPIRQSGRRERTDMDGGNGRFRESIDRKTRRWRPTRLRHYRPVADGLDTAPTAAYSPGGLGRGSFLVRARDCTRPTAKRSIALWAAHTRVFGERHRTGSWLAVARRGRTRWESQSTGHRQM